MRSEPRAQCRLAKTPRLHARAPMSGRTPQNPAVREPRSTLPLSVDNHPKIPTLRAVDHCAYTVPDLDEAVQFFVDHFGAELVFYDGPFLDAERLVGLQPCDPNHEELVEIARRDGKEPHPLKQRVVRVAGFLEHAPVERQPAELAVEEPRFGRCSSGRGRAGGALRARGNVGYAIHRLSTESEYAGGRVHVMSLN